VTALTVLGNPKKSQNLLFVPSRRDMATETFGYPVSPGKPERRPIMVEVVDSEGLHTVAFSAVVGRIHAPMGVTMARQAVGFQGAKVGRFHRNSVSRHLAESMTVLAFN